MSLSHYDSWLDAGGSPQDRDETEDLKTGEPVHDMWLDKLALMKEEMGTDAFNDFALKLAEREEADLRSRKPDHPLLVLLDNHRKKEEQGFF